MTTILLSEITAVRVLCKAPSCGAVAEVAADGLPEALPGGLCPACGRPAVDVTDGNPLALLARAVRAVATPETRGDVELVLVVPEDAARSGSQPPAYCPDDAVAHGMEGPEPEAPPHAPIRCRDLAPPEQARVTGLEGEIAVRFAARGISVGTCYALGDGERRMLCFGDAEGRVLGSVTAADFLDAPADRAADAITVWRAD